MAQDELTRLKEEEELLMLKAEEERLAAQVAKPSAPTAPAQPFDPLAAFETYTRSIAEGVSLGASEWASSKINAVVNNLIQAGENPKDVADFFAAAFDPEKIQQQYQLDVERRRALKARYPEFAMGGELTSGLIPFGPAAKAAGAVAKGAGALIEAGAATQAAQALAKVPGAPALGQLAGAAGIGAATAGSMYGTQKALEEAAGFVRPGELPDVSQVAGLGAGVGAGIAALPAVPAMAKFGLSAATRVPKEAIEGYLQEPAVIRPMIEEAMAPGGLTPQAQVWSRIGAAVEPFEKQLIEAEKAVISTKGELAATKGELASAIKIKKEKLQEQLSKAETAAAGAKKTETQFYKAAKLPETFADDIVDSATALKARLGEESRKSYSILEEQKGAADFTNILPEVQATQQSLLVDGQLLSAEEAKAFAAVQDWMEKLPKVMGDFGAVPFPRVKRIIQSLDRDLEKVSTHGSADFSELTYSKLMEFRRLLDSRLKSIPEYAKQMETVNGLMELRGKVSSFLGRENKIAGKLDRLWVPNNPDADLVARLGQETGKDFATPLVEFGARKQIGASPALLQQAIDQLPETSQLLKAQARVRRSKRFGAEERLAPEEYTAWVQSETDAAAAQNALLKADKMVKAMGPLANERGRFSAVRQLMLGKNPAYETYLSELSKMSGEDFTREVNAARTAEQLLTRSGVASSKMTNTFAFSAAGGMTFLTGDPQLGGAAVGLGAVLGNLSDAYGARFAQKALDAYLSVQGMPTVSKLMTAFQGLPDSLRAQVVGDFARAVAASRQEIFDVPKVQRSYAEAEIKASQALSPLQKARATQMIRQQGLIDAETVKSVMLGQPAAMPSPAKALGYDVFKAKRRPEVEAERR